MNSWTEAELQQQYSRALVNGWIGCFVAAAARHGFTPEFLIAIASRETNLKDIKGDVRDGIFHGFGIMQVDARSFPAFCESWHCGQVEQSIEFATQVLASMREQLAGHHIIDLKSLAAAYNTGPSNVLRSYARHRDVDTTTSGGNYGRDVLNRMDVFARLLAPGRPKAA